MTGTTRTLARRRTGVRTLGLLVLLVTAVTAAAPGVIRIRPGDTLSELALRHHTTVAKLQAANHLHGTMIYAGQLLTLPGNATPAAAPARRTVTASRSYTVRGGDTLIGLAHRFRTTPSALAARNHLRGTMLLLGQRLTYAETVTTAAPARVTLAPGVAASAARHRATLASRSLPGRAKVKDLIRAAARRHGVPVDLALALAWQESGFQQRVVSPVDAIGVMQVLPSTARSLGRIHGRSFDLLKASDNVEAGVWLLRDLLDATGSASGAMAGYYQGLGSVARIGLLPETHAYIANITLLRARFR
ncbi:MAG: LysM peptidoglycan-binding domain-containing protein [Mycobacteriales bacterium]